MSYIWTGASCNVVLFAASTAARLLAPLALASDARASARAVVSPARCVIKPGNRTEIHAVAARNEGRSRAFLIGSRDGGEEEEEDESSQDCVLVDSQLFVVIIPRNKDVLLLGSESVAVVSARKKRRNTTKGGESFGSCSF